MASRDWASTVPAALARTPAVTSQGDAVIAVDVGGTTIKAATIGADGRFLHEISRPTPARRGPKAVIDELQAIVAELLSRARAGGQPAVGSVDMAAPSRPPWNVRSVAVVVPGVVDAAAGRAEFSANLGFRDVPVRDLVQAAVGLPTVLEHDVRAAGVAERAVGIARGVDDYLLAVIGTGIAAVMHAGGQPVRGARGIAGELGHIPVWPGGEPCPCGQRGCLERYASASSITRRYAELGGSHVGSAREVAVQRRSDRAAERSWREATEALAIAFVTCTMLLDPGMIVLAGGLSAAGEDLLAPIEAAMAARITWRDPPPVRLSPLGGRAGLVGAGVLAWQLVGGDALGSELSASPGTGPGRDCG